MTNRSRYLIEAEELLKEILTVPKYYDNELIIVPALGNTSKAQRYVVIFNQLEAKPWWIPHEENIFIEMPMLLKELHLYLAGIRMDLIYFPDTFSESVV